MWGVRPHRTRENDVNSEIMFFQSTAIGTTPNEPGLFELFLSHYNSLEDVSVFDKVQVIVPNHAMSSFLKDRVALSLCICANLDFVVLPGPVIENIYKANNPNEIIFDFKEAKYIAFSSYLNSKLLLLNHSKILTCPYTEASFIANSSYSKLIILFLNHSKTET